MTEIPVPPPDAERRSYRPPIGIPIEVKGRTQSVLASVVIHVLLILLVIGPILVRTVLEPIAQGAGGPGAAGGGGGGRRGTGGRVQEGLRYMHFEVPQPAPARPEVVPLPPPPPQEKMPQPPAARPPEPAPAPPDAVTEGSGGGTGADGTSGSGPGSGGGVGSGVGTGRGSGTGPGTGGGDAQVYPPVVINLAILPIPVPARVRPYKLVAWFEVDERGNARLLSYNPSKDAGYNRRILDMLHEVRFRPAVRADGSPVRDTTFISAEAP